MTAKQLEAIEQHGQNLLAIFPHATVTNPVRLCRALRRLEVEARKHTLELCNGDEPRPHDEWWQQRHDNELYKILCKVNRLLCNFVNDDDAVPVFINRDPRGYALKIESKYMADKQTDAKLGPPSVNPFWALHKDFGGYGILAPAIGKDGR